LTISTTLTATSAAGVSTDYVVGSAVASAAALRSSLSTANAALLAAARGGWRIRDGVESNRYFWARRLPKR
jgi:hypothetical protein